MARPLKDEIDYFSHDTNMSNDGKIELVEYKFKNDGYAIYNKILEKVYSTNGKFELNCDEHFELYGNKWHVGFERLKQIIEYFQKINLFPSENFISNGVKKRLKKIQAERKRRRNYHKTKEDTKGVMDVQNTDETRIIPPKVKESKLNKSKEKETLNQQFENVWAEYPRREGKKAAYKHYQVSVNSEQDLLDLKSAITNYKILTKDTEKKFIKMGDTFFNNWQDYIPNKKSNGVGMFDGWTVEQIRKHLIYEQGYPGDQLKNNDDLSGQLNQIPFFTWQLEQVFRLKPELNIYNFPV